MGIPLDHKRLCIVFLGIQMQEEEEVDDAVLARLIEKRQQGKKRKRRWWVRPWIERRRLFGQYDTLFKELERESQDDYLDYILMDPNLFAELLLRVTPRITKGPRSVQYRHFENVSFSARQNFCSVHPPQHIIVHVQSSSSSPSLHHHHHLGHHGHGHH